MSSARIGQWGLELFTRLSCTRIERSAFGREKYYEKAGIADYMFRLGPNEVVDASVRGCRARYVNHSCDPNCFAVSELGRIKHQLGSSQPLRVLATFVVTLPTHQDASAGVKLAVLHDEAIGMDEVDTDAPDAPALWHPGRDEAVPDLGPRMRRNSTKNTGLEGRYWYAASRRRSGVGTGKREAALDSREKPVHGDDSGGGDGVTVSGRRVFVYALRPIRRGEELTYDYSFSSGEKIVACRCGAANCRGTLNVQ